MSEIGERYRRLAEQFDVKVNAVAPPAWEQPSPNPGWTARDVVKHIVDTSSHFLGKVGRSIPPGPSADDDPPMAWRQARDAIQNALDDPNVAQIPVESMGATMPWDQFVEDYLCFDLVVHAWDLARAAGVDDSLDEISVRETKARAESFAEVGRKMGAFGPEVEVPQDASEQEQLLGLLGRRP